MTIPRRASSAPKKPLPPGAWDCHAHVFGPFDRYPLLAHRRYDPPHGPAADYLLALDEAGFENGVLVHASAYGYDNDCTRDALGAADDRARGVCVIEPSISDAELARLHAAGFRSVRVTETGPRARAYSGSIGCDEIEALAPRLAALGWHAQFWADCSWTVAHADRLQALGLPVIFDHMGYFDAAEGVEAPTFRAFCDLLRRSDFWVKMTPIRLKPQQADFADIRPFHERLLEIVPDRAVFGSDWPFIGMNDPAPDTGALVDLFDRWTPDATLRRAILVDNPAAFYASAAA